MRHAFTAMLALASAGAVADHGDAQAGASKSNSCGACHGPRGNSSNPDWPKLAGQHAAYLIRQLEAFKSGARKDPLMSPQAARLNQQHMHDLAAYYAAQKPR